MIIALVTLYYPDEKNVQNIRKLETQVDKIFLCDNSEENNYNMFAGISPKINYVADKINYGLSAAFNRVLEKYHFNDEDYIIFFDQDSSIEEEHIKKMIVDYENLVEQGISVGCLGPAYFNCNSGTIELPRLKKNFGNGICFVTSVITSSMLCKYGVLKDVGFWNEEMFLDLADWDLCWRMKLKGYQICLSQNVLLTHSLGESEKRCGKLRVREEVPVREYYQTRDSLYLLKKAYVPFKCRLRLLATIYIRPILHILFLDDTKTRIRYIKKAKKDYKDNIHGVFNDN